jgi:uncharacterized protein YdaU (DUF1376 family)
MSGQPWFKFYASDFLLDEKVVDLSEAGIGMLVKLWCVHWRLGFVPNSVQTAAKFARISTKKLTREWPNLVPFFTQVETENGPVLVSERMLREQEASEAKANKLAENGRRGGQAKSSKCQTNAVANATNLPKQNPSLARATESESESESEKNIKTHPPTPASGGAENGPPEAGAEKPKPRHRPPPWNVALPPEVVGATNRILDFWPGAGDLQPDGRTPVPGASPPQLAARLDAIRRKGGDLEICVAIAERSVREWREGKWTKAPQYFFGKTRDAPWENYYQAHVTKAQARQAQARGA